MSLDLAQEIWSELKQFLSEVDRSDAADCLVHLLVDHDYDADSIKSAFKSDGDVKSSLRAYISELEGDTAEDDEEAEYDDYDDDNDDDD